MCNHSRGPDYNIVANPAGKRLAAVRHWVLHTQGAAQRCVLFLINYVYWCHLCVALWYIQLALYGLTHFDILTSSWSARTDAFRTDLVPTILLSAASAYNQTREFHQSRRNFAAASALRFISYPSVLFLVLPCCAFMKSLMCSIWPLIWIPS